MKDLFPEWGKSKAIVKGHAKPKQPKPPSHVRHISRLRMEAVNGTIEVDDPFHGGTIAVSMFDIEEAARATGFVQIEVSAGDFAGMTYDEMQKRLADNNVIVSKPTAIQIPS
jgi:hypothetical protein